MASQADLAALGARLEAVGVAAKAGTATELARRRVAGMIAFDDPSGHRLEVFWGAALDNRPAFCPYGVRFLTGDQGMGHVVIPAADDDASMEFYAGVLGFRLRDTMAMAPELFGRPAGGRPAMMRFLGCNPRHHSLALAPMTHPSGCVHVMVEVASLGRHANDHMVSFYLRTPAGFDIEYGTDGLLVDDATWVSRFTTAVSEWEHVFDLG